MSSRCKAQPRPPNDSKSSADSGKATETSTVLLYTRLPACEQEVLKKLGMPQVQVVQGVRASEYNKERLGPRLWPNHRLFSTFQAEIGGQTAGVGFRQVTPTEWPKSWILASMQKNAAVHAGLPTQPGPVPIGTGPGMVQTLVLIPTKGQAALVPSKGD